MAAKKALDLKVLDELLSVIDKVYDKLLEIEEKLDKLDSRSQKLRIGRSLLSVVKSLESVLTELVGLGRMKVDWRVLDRLAGFIDRVIAIGERAKKSGTSIRVIKTLGTTIADMLSSISSNNTGIVGKALGDISRLIKIFVVLPVMFGFLTLTFKAIALVSIFIPSQGTFTTLVKSMRILGQAMVLMNQGLGAGSSGLSAFLATLAAVVRIGVLMPIAFTALTVVFRLVALVAMLVPGQNSFAALTKGFFLLGTAFADMNAAFGGGKKSALSGFFATLASVIRIGILFPLAMTWMTVIFRAISIISVALPGQDAFTKLAGGFHSLALAFKAINAAFGGGQKSPGNALLATLASVVRIGLIFPIIFTQLSVIFRAVSAILSVMPGGNAFKSLAVGFTHIGEAMLNIQLATKGFNILSLFKLRTLLGQIGGAFRNMTAAFVKTGNVDAFAAVAKGFADIGAGLQSIQAVSKSFNIATLLKLAIFMTGLKAIIVRLGKGVTPTQAQTITVIANAIGIVVAAVRRIVNSLSDINILGAVSLGPINKIFNSLRGMVKTISGLSTNRRVNVSSLPQIVELVKAISGVIRILAGLNKLQVNANSAKMFEAVKQQFNGMKSIIQTIAGVRSSRAKDLAGFAESIAHLLLAISKVAVKPAAFTNFSVIAEKLSEAVKKFNVGLFSGGKIKQIRSLAEAFALLSKVKFAATADFVKALSALQHLNLKNVNLNGLSSVFKSIAEASKNLPDIDETKLANFKTYAESLKTVSDLNGDLNKSNSLLSRNAFPTAGVIDRNKDLANVIADGTEKGIHRILVFQTLVRAITQFNPISLAIKIGHFFESVYGRIKQVVDFVLYLNRKVKESIQYIEQLGQNLANIGSNLLGKFGIGALVGSAGFQAAISFDALSTRLQTFGRLTDEETARAERFADVIGIQYPLSSNDALDAMLSLTKAGQNLPDIERILPSAADLAALSDSGDIKQATSILIGAQAAFRDFTDEIPGTFDNIAVASDLVANTADLTLASVEQLQEGLANVGPLANQYGLSFADVNAILGTFSDNNLLGAEAGTALKSLLTNLSTDTAKNELQKLGVSLVDSQGNFRDFNDIINDLNTSLNETKTIQIASLPGVDAANRGQVEEAKKVLESASRQLFLWQHGLASGSGDAETASNKIAEYNRQIAAAQGFIAQLTGSQETANYVTREVTRSQQQNAESIKNLFGAYGQIGGSILLTAGGFGDLREEIVGSGTAAERARQLLDNMAGDILQLQGSVETLNTRAFRPLIDKIFRPFVKLGRLIVDSILGMDTAALEFISTAIAFGSILATIVGAGLIVIGTLAQIGSGFALLAISATSIITATGAIVGTFLAVAAGAVVLIGAITGIVAVLAAITAAFEAVRKVFTDDIGGARTSFEAFFNVIKTGGAALIGFFQALGQLVSAIFSPSSTQGLESFGSGLSRLFESLANSTFITKATANLTALTDIFNVVTAALTLDNRVEQAGQNTRNALMSVAQYTGMGADSIERQVKYSEQQIRDQYKALAGTLANNPLVKQFFGASSKTRLEQEALEEYIAQFLYFAHQLRGAFGSITGAFGTFFTDLRTKSFSDAFDDLSKNLTKGFTGLTRVFLQGLQDIFKVDFSKEIGILDSQGLSAGLVALFQRALLGVKNAIIKNRGFITSVLSAVFKTFFAPLKSIGFVAKIFGIDTLSNVVDEIQKVVGGLFEGILNTIFNLLEGQDLATALLNAFGPGIQPVLDFAEAVGDIVDTILGIFSNLFGGLSQAAEDASGGLSLPQILEGILGGMTTFLKGFNEQILIPITQGDLLGALANIADMIGSDFLGSIVEDLAAGDFLGLLTDIANELASLLTRAIALVPELIISLGETLNSPLLTKIGTNLQTGDWTSVISTMANALMTIISSALAAVPGLIIDFGTLINSPLLTKIGEDLQAGDYTTVIDTIATSLRDLVVSALGRVPELLVVLGTALDLSFLTDIGLSLEQSDAFTTFVESVGNLVALPIETVVSIADSLGKIATAVIRLGQTDPVILAAIGVALGVIFVQLGGGFVSLIALVKVGATAIAGALIPIAGLIAVVLLLKNGLEAIADVVSGKKNIFEGIASFFTGLASDALALLGVEITPEEIASRITTFFNSVNGIVTLFLSSTVNQIKTSFTNIIDGIIGSIDDATARLDQSVLGGDTGFGDLFFQLQQDIENNNFRAIGQTLADAAEKGLDLEPFRRALRNNFTGIMETFKTDLPNLLSFSQEDFGAVVTSLVNANALDDAIALVPKDQLGEFYQRLFSVSPELLAGLDFSTIQGQLASALATGVFDLSQVTDFVMKLPNLSDAQKQALIDGLAAQMAVPPSGGTPAEVPLSVKPVPFISAEDFALLPSDVQAAMRRTYGETVGTQPGEVPLDVDVPIKPTPVVTEDAGSTLQEDINIATQEVLDQVAGTGDSFTAIEPVVPITPDFTMPTTPEEAQLFADNLLVALTNLGLLQDGLVTFATNSQPAIDQLNAMGGGLNIIHVNIAIVIQRIQQLLTIFNMYSITIAPLLTIDALVWKAWSENVKESLDIVLTKLTKLKEEVYLITTALALIGSTELAAIQASVGGGTGGGGGLQPDGGGAYGASTQMGGMWKIIERGFPELYQENGNTYLLPSGNGKIIPATQVPDISSLGGRGLNSMPGGVSNGASLTGSTNSVIINDGDIQINVDGAGVSNAQELSDIIVERVQKAKEQNYSTFRTRLRTNHR